MQRAETTLTRIYIHQRKKRTKSGREKNFFCCCWLIYYVTFGFLWRFWYTRNFFRFLFLFESIEKRTCFIYLLWHAYICRVWKVPHQMKIVHFIFLDFCRVFFMCSVWRIFGWCGVLLHLFKGNINHPLWWCLMVFFRIVLFRLVFFQWCFIHSLLTPTHPHCCSIIFHQLTFFTIRLYMFVFNSKFFFVFVGRQQYLQKHHDKPIKSTQIQHISKV